MMKSTLWRRTKTTTVMAVARRKIGEEKGVFGGCGVNAIGQGRARLSTWASVPMGPRDPIMGLTEAFKEDTYPKKINLGVGAYRDDNGKPFVLDSIREAERRILEKNLDHEYLGIVGDQEYLKLSLEFGYGEGSPVLKNGQVAAVQTLSGTGACRILGQFFSRFFGQGTPIYLPNPTWGNHLPIFRDSGMELRQYRYYEKDSCGLDFQGLKEDLDSAPDNSIVMLHACAHNPTGVDPSVDQWDELSSLILRKNHHVFFDCAYQGFASGDAERDAYALRKFVNDGHLITLSQSFAKNFGLYGERIGTLSVVCSDKDEAARVLSQLKIIIRPMYSNPPCNGARIVKTVLEDPVLRSEWSKECAAMADRIKSMRTLLRENLESLGSKRSWKHITDQIGMFCYSGLTKEQVHKLRSDFHIYLTDNGRISMAGVTTKNVDYLASAIGKVSEG